MVANGDNGSQRQLVKDGFGGVTTLGGASAVALYEDATGTNNSFLYVAAPGEVDARLNIFKVGKLTGDLHVCRSRYFLARIRTGVRWRSRAAMEPRCSRLEVPLSISTHEILAMEASLWSISSRRALMILL